MFRENSKNRAVFHSPVTLACRTVQENTHLTGLGAALHLAILWPIYTPALLHYGLSRTPHCCPFIQGYAPTNFSGPRPASMLHAYRRYPCACGALRDTTPNQCVITTYWRQTPHQTQEFRKECACQRRLELSTARKKNRRTT